ncbi:MAG: CpaF family protein [Candidatus Diapherotrites archaeon]|uniref:CpaF family protein n=1 Tax=Candidatus Iainarchaeum sp. TaxID=3101447 RepID=A0A8T4C688_9ARCH|nr:CpaF family protein [Candidatus Diapherotrites archaeon]
MNVGMSPVRGIQLAETAFAKIMEGFPHNEYLIKKNTFNTDEEKLFRSLAGALNRSYHSDEWMGKLPSSVSKSFASAFKTSVLSYADTTEIVDKLPLEEDWAKARELLLKVLNENDVPVNDKESFVERVLDEGVGYGYLGPLMRDAQLEEIMVNGTSRNVFVYHSKYGMCKTDIFIPMHDVNLLRIIAKAAKFAGRGFHEKEPLLDARLPDGSRLNATYESVTLSGHTLTIRKFTHNTLSLTELMKNGAVSTELAAFLWLMCEGMNVYPMNVIITGGSGTGKTTLLNALASVIRYRDRIITIEDTTELKFLHRDNWISLESRPASVNAPAVTMNDLLQNSLRMRPDRLILGEVRGEEAQTLFVAMDTGHQGCLGTLHSNSAREMLVRLSTEPMNVPQNLVHLLNMVIVLQKVQDYKEGMKRRVMQLAEVSHIDTNVLLSNIYERNPETDLIMRTDTPSHLMQVMADVSGKNKQHIQQEINVREQILRWMLKHNVLENEKVEKIIQQYYFDPASVLEYVNKDM